MKGRRSERAAPEADRDGAKASFHDAEEAAADFKSPCHGAGSQPSLTVTVQVGVVHPFPN